MPIVLKSGSLSLLESSGPVKACNGIALPFYWNFRQKTQITLTVKLASEEVKDVTEDRIRDDDWMTGSVQCLCPTVLAPRRSATDTNFPRSIRGPAPSYTIL
jgi:hypothetical protein